MPIKSYETSPEETALAFNMQTQCLAQAFSQKQHSRSNLPTLDFLQMGFCWCAEYTEWNGGFMVYQSSYSVYPSRSKHTRFLITEADIQEGSEATVWPSVKFTCTDLCYTEVSASSIPGFFRPCLELISQKQLTYKLVVLLLEWLAT